MILCKLEASSVMPERALVIYTYVDHELNFNPKNQKHLILSTSCFWQSIRAHKWSLIVFRLFSSNEAFSWLS